VHATCWFHKPDSYFDASWRREPGAGPVLVNLIHDLDLLRYLCGEVDEVQAIESNGRRGFAVEDTAALLLRFKSGALGTVTVSDTISAPWSWEFTSGENPDYSQSREASYMIGGTLGSLAIPTLDVWSHERAPDWWSPIRRERIEVGAEDPLALQVRNLCDVVRRRADPVVSGRDGLAALQIVLAAKQAASTRQPVKVG
jgi:predicted dehydrogenase